MDTRRSDSNGVRDNLGAAGQKQVGTDSGSLVWGGECGRESLPSARRWQRPAPGQWGRGGGGAEGAEITAAPPGTLRVPSGPHAGPQTMTTGSRPRSNKRESLPRAPPPPTACLGGWGGGPGGLQWPGAPAAASPAPTPRASARLPAARRTLRRSPLPRKTSSLAS